MAKRQMQCSVCKLWIPADSEYQVNVPNHYTKGSQDRCSGSRRGPIDKKGFKK